jgi:pimeloyl-ACP methyl ester carboxylesterase
MKNIRAKGLAPFALAATLATLVAACATTPRTELRTGSIANECVVLLHGLNRSWRAMRDMAEGLQAQGFTTINVDYPSQSGTIDEVAPLAVDTGLAACRKTGATRIHFVTHSIGGILLRYSVDKSPVNDLGRVVMLAPPNQGSEIVDRTGSWPGAEIFSGKAGLQLGTGPDSVPSKLGPVEFELGIIAGTGTMNPWMSAMLPDPDDGKVSVESTRVAGMDDFLLVDNNHHYITESEDVIRNTGYFLRHGHFEKTAKGAN